MQATEKFRHSTYRKINLKTFGPTFNQNHYQDI